MMNRRSLAYSTLLFLTLVVVSVLFSQGLVQGVINNTDIRLALVDPQAGTLPAGTLPVSTTDHLLGQPVKWVGNLEFADGEEATIHQVRLVVDGPQPMDVSIPIAPGHYDIDSGDNPDVSGVLSLDVSYFGVDQLGGTLPINTDLPFSTLGGGGQFKGTGLGARISYDITWIPPVFLDPAPVFTLIPEADILFPIPQLAVPEDGIGTVLPETDLKFPIPTIGAPTGTVLPDADELFDIPTVTISSTAPSELPDLPATTAGFNIPTVSVGAAPSGVSHNFPDSTAAFDVPSLSTGSAPSGVPDLNDTTLSFVLPDLAALGLIPTAPGGVSNLPATAEQFATPSNLSPRGMGYDGTNIWLVLDGATRDQILAVNTSGVIVAGPVDGPSDSLDGITYLNGSLWVVENLHRCFEDINNDFTTDEDRCDRSHRIFKVDPGSLPADDDDWADLFPTSVNAPSADTWRDIGGITSEGTGASGTLWLVDGLYGESFFNIDQAGIEIDSVFVDNFGGRMDGAAFSDGVLYTSDGDEVTAWTTDGNRISDTSTNPSRDNIRGMTYVQVSGENVLFIASQTEKKIYAGFFATTVTQNPRALAYSQSGDAPGEAIWVLADGSPVDKILKIDASDGSLIADFGPDSDGVADSPSADTEGMTFLDGDLWVVANQGFVRKLYKIDASTGANLMEFDLGNTANLFDDIGGMGNDGTNLILYAKDWNTIYEIDPSNGDRLNIGFPCCPPTLNGARGIAHHSGRDQFYFAKSSKMGTLDGDFDFDSESGVTEDGSTIASIQGMVFNGDLLYVAINGQVNQGFLATVVTTIPEGVAMSPTSATIGRALWVLVDAEPNDKILKINPDTGNLDTTWGTGSSGAVDAPSPRTEGVTFMDNALWVVANTPFDGAVLYEINPATGSVNNQHNLNFSANVWDDLGGITNDGTDLVVWSKPGNSVWMVDTNGGSAGAGQAFPCCPSFFGSRGLTYHADRSEFFAARNGKIASFSGDQWNMLQEYTAKEAGSNITGIEGLTMDGNVLYMVRNDSSTGKVSKGFLATSVTTTPKGMAFTGSATTAGRALWILVDGDPTDRLLKVDPSTGQLNSGFGSSGSVDAPSKKTEGITYLDGSLWIIANENFERMLYEVSITDGSTTNSYQLGMINVWDDLGGITNNGTDLVVFAKSFNNAWTIDTGVTESEQFFPCCPLNNGAQSIAFHSTRAQFFSAENGRLATFNSEFNHLRDLNITEDGSGVDDVEGLTFDGDVLYVARDDAGTGKVSSGALRSTVTDEPLAIAYSPDGSSSLGTPIGEALFVLVDGEPNDFILKLDKTTGALDTTFSSDGAAPAPDDRASGMTFLDNFLWVISNSFDGPIMYKISAVDGSVSETFELNNTGGMGIFQNLGGLTTDGTDLLAYSEDFSDLFTIEDDGFVDNQEFLCCSSINGADGVAYRSSADQIFIGRDDRLAQYVMADFGWMSANEINFDNAVIDAIGGMTFGGDVLYMAHELSDTGKVSSASVPSDITNEPLGLAYDEGNDEVYILVEGRKNDHIIVTEPEPDGFGDAVVIRDFEVPSSEAGSVTFMNGSLFVSARDVDPFDPFFSFGPVTILELDPADGNEINTLFPPVFDDIQGMSNDGDSLIVIPEFGGPHAIFIDPNNGNEEFRQFFFSQFGFLPDSYEGLATRSVDDETEFFPMLGDTVFRYDEIGRLVEEIDVDTTATAEFGAIQGAVFVGPLLFMVDEDSLSVHATGIPVPPTTISTSPRAMATDGTNLFVVVDGEPNDKIMKLDTSGNLVTAFGDGGAIDSPGTETDALAFHNGMLYVVTNDEKTIDDGFGFFFVEDFPVIAVLDPSTGEETDEFEIMVDNPFNPFGPPEVLHDPIGALASDGVDLFAGVDGTEGVSGVWFIIDPDNPFQVAEPRAAFSGILPDMPGFQSFEVITDSLFSEDRQLLASGSSNQHGEAHSIARFDRETGVMFDIFEVEGSRDITGTAYMGLTLYIADANTDSVLGTALPENTVEQTVIGEYDSHLMVDVSENLSTNATTMSGLVDFDVVKNDTVVVEFTTIEPVGGTPVSLEPGFILTSAETTIKGLVSDPAIASVLVGIRLPFTFLLQDDVENTDASEALWDRQSDIGGDPSFWHIQTDSDRASSGDNSWRFGVPSTNNFSTGLKTEGTLTSVDPVEINFGTRLEFQTGFGTELGADRDIKMIEVAPVTFDIQGNVQVGEFVPYAQIVGQGAGNGAPAGAHPEFQHIELDPLFLNPTLVPVSIDLTPLAGQQGMIRFRFDSVDRFANDGEGWYLDDIRLAGEGFKAISVGTELLPLPLEQNGVKFYSSFSTDFDLAEGQNEVGATGQQPYSPLLRGDTLVTGFVDQTLPVVVLSGLPDATSNLVQTLDGFVDDATFQSLEVTHTGPSGDPQVIFSLASLPTDGLFSIPVSLVEGVNTFEATVLDGGGLDNADSILTTGDVTPPTATVDIVTVTSEGEAVQGDDYFIVVAAQDSLSGVASVEDSATNDPFAHIGETPGILVEMHGLGDIDGTAVTHIQLSDVQPGTPIGENTVSVRIVDAAGNQATVNGVLDVVSARSNRNYFLFPGVNFMGLALIPDDGEDATTDDASLDRLMLQDVTDNVDEDYATALGGTVTLGDVIESTFAFNNAGNFIVHTPGDGATDTLTDLEPFQGMTVKTKASAEVDSVDHDVFKEVNVEGFTADQSVPIRVNIQGVFFRQGELPPDKQLRTGYNLIAPHILEDTIFDTVFRGALIPDELAVSAITFDREVNPTSDSGDIAAEIFEGFVTNSLGDFLEPVLSYWTFVVDDPNNPAAPIITP